MEKIAIIKLGAKGDVVRTLPVLLAINEKYPNSEITWITKPQSLEILKTSPFIDKILTIPCNVSESFDVLYNFDIDEEATKLSSEIKADKKFGFYSEQGYATAFNLPAEYYLNTLFDDELKKINKKTYQEMMFEAAELNYNKQHHPIFLSEINRKYAEEFLKLNNLNSKKLIGIHLGASPRWPSKSWHQEKLKEFVQKAKDQGYEILLFGGPDESQKHKSFINELKDEGLTVYQNNPQNTDLEFASLINICNKVISADSFAMHIALALKKPTIGLFFCTSPNEVEGYGLLKKIVSPKLKEFFPEKSDQYNEDLVKSISADEILEAIGTH